MKTLNFVGTGVYAQKPVLIDFEKHTVDTLDACRAAINDIYIAPEDIEIRYKKNGRDVVIKAETGDIIITFYREDWIAYPVVVVKNKELKLDEFYTVQNEKESDVKKVFDKLNKE